MSFKGFGGEKIFTDAVKDAIGNDLVLDQFDIEYASSFYGSSADDYITGSILTRKKNPFYGDSKVFYTFSTGSRGRIFRKSEADAQPYDDVPWGLRVNRSYRALQLFDADEKFYDSYQSSQKYPDKHFDVAEFGSPYGLAIDKLGNFYVSDYLYNCIRKVTPTGIVTNLAGSPGAGYTDGTGTAAKFRGPVGLTTDNDNNIYVCDYVNNTIRKVTQDGVVTTLAGDPTVPGGYLDGTGSSANFDGPRWITFDPTQNLLYVADQANYRIRAVTLSGVVTTYAGTGSPGFVNGNRTTTAAFGQLEMITIDSKGNLFVADNGNNAIRKISGLTVTTVAGDGSYNWVDGPLSVAKFQNPTGLCSDSKGNLYVTEEYRVRKISFDGIVSTIAGGNFPGFSYGQLSETRFSGPAAIVALENDLLYLNDVSSRCMCRLDNEKSLLFAGKPFSNSYLNTQQTIKFQPYGSMPGPESALLGTKSMFRRDKYGQNRDMLEQRAYSKFIRSLPSPVDYDAIVPADFALVPKDKIGGLVSAAPTPTAVTVDFVKQKYEVDGRGIGRIFSEAIEPISGTSQNLSTEAVSVDAFYDGVSLQR